MIVLPFASGALGTVNVSDAIQSLGAGNHRGVHHTQGNCDQIGGARASLAVPQLDLASAGQGQLVGAD